MRLMECLTPTISFDMFMDNYFRYFRLLTLLGANKIWATCVFKKSSLRKSTIIGNIWGQTAAKEKKSGHFKQRTSSKKAV